MDNNQNMMGIFTFIVALATLIAGLLGYFVPADMRAPVADAPVVVAPTPAPAPTPTPAPQPAAPTSIAVSELNTFLETAYIDGNEDADVLVIEFTDYQCPFCQRHANNGTLDQVKDKYDNVGIVSAHFPLSFHPLAQDASEATECAADQYEGAESYYAMKKELFALGANPTLDNIRTAATNAGFDADAIADCVQADTFNQKVKDQMAFGRKLGVTGTPGNIVINTESGEFTKVSGAVPAAAFDPAIAQYSN